MKKFTFLVFFFFLFAIAELPAQNYLVNFTGSGLSTTVESVFVKNLTQSNLLYMLGSDTLFLGAHVGIEQLSGSRGGLQICPNPLTSAGKMEFTTSKSGRVLAEIFDMTGKTILRRDMQLPQGTHAFTLSGLRTGLYTAVVITPGGMLTGRIMSACETRVHPRWIMKAAGSQISVRNY